MSGVMPYVMEKGPYFSVLESKLADPQQRRQLLLDLRAGKALADLSGLDSQATLKNDKLSVADRIKHLNEDWFGMAKVGGQWTKQPGNFPTGFWVGYQGDPEAILRNAMTHAIEVSLDLAPGAAPSGASAASARQWPIDVYWICQGPWFQCWVVWRKSDTTATGGHVTLVITTPMTMGHPLTTRITRPGYANPAPAGDKNAEYAAAPPETARGNDRGMWVVGHEDYTKTVNLSTIGTRNGLIAFPSVEWRAKSLDVKRVAPAEWEGGVLANGRAYQPQP